MIKRVFDISLTSTSIIILLPVFFFISLLIIFDSKGGAFYRQIRVGKNNKDFVLYKFRTMRTGASKKGLITIGNNDPRITKTGLFLRKYKLDELPQLFNVLIGDMSIVGPRPEVREYVEMYDNKQLKVLSVKPGITDYASLEYINENEILGDSENPIELYINKVMPEKLALNLKYINEKNLSVDIKIIILTIRKILY